jgi:hypothetical protein
MRLLSLDSHGNVAWNEFTQDRLPPYAILSHTWETEEVTFADMVNGHAQSRAGYRKITFCGEQAARDGLKYFWVDSCCINKESSAELTEAINTMFRWYHGAVKCYVYLSDVSTSASNASQAVWEADFRKSRWFTRGWTLQELLAPVCVEFYSCQHQRLGNKESLCLLIRDITRIPVEALRGHPLDAFSNEERMRWAEGRQTTKDEDGAYCLLGIFNVFMPLIYGEGKDSALRRLQRELDGLPATGRTFADEYDEFMTALTCCSQPVPVLLYPSNAMLGSRAVSRSLPTSRVGSSSANKRPRWPLSGSVG